MNIIQIQTFNKIYWKNRRYKIESCITESVVFGLLSLYTYTLFFDNTIIDINNPGSFFEEIYKFTISAGEYVFSRN